MHGYRCCHQTSVKLSNQVYSRNKNKNKKQQQEHETRTRTRNSNKNTKREQATRTRTRNSNKNKKQEQETIKLSHLYQSVDGSSLFSKQEQEQEGELSSEQREHEKRSMELLQVV
ncbi:hypothetical protein CY35_03G120700 [Sphagnum magellanicum]|jgi:hypothetical protein|nr:hypothetical protein CY35_03G120700 [Sphagnum magellanicum]